MSLPPVERPATPFERMMIPRSPTIPKEIDKGEVDLLVEIENTKEIFKREWQRKVFRNVYDYPGHRKIKKREGK
jgi:hypothetical protein